MKRTALLPKAGYRVIEAMASEVGRIDDVHLSKVETKSYPHAILFDFESCDGNKQRKEVTPTLTIENVHVPISVTPMKESPPISVKETPRSWSASLWKSWRDAEKTSGPMCERSSCQKTCTCLQKRSGKKSRNGATRFLSLGSNQAVTT